MRLQRIIAIVSVFGFFCQSEASYTVTIRKFQDEDKTPGAGPVKDSKQCGGSGELVGFRMELCNQRGPCEIPDGRILMGEIEFKPSADMAEMKFKITFTLKEGTTVDVYESNVPRSTVTKGDVYMIQFFGEAGIPFRGRSIKAKYELINVADDKVDVCVEADITFFSYQ